MKAELSNIVPNNNDWINPLGGLGDQLMLSGVLKHAHDHMPGKQFNLARRTHYLNFLDNHPAISYVGFPPEDAKFRRVDYWAMEPLGANDQRPFQILAREFGLTTPLDEKLFIPDYKNEAKKLIDYIPWKKYNILIAPASDSPRKVMMTDHWHELVERLKIDGFMVIQVGKKVDQHIRNSYSIRGLTTPRQLVNIIEHCDLVITSDNFAMHAAHMVNTSAVVLWGATRHQVYGYPEQCHIQNKHTCELPTDEDCIDLKHSHEGRLYTTHCPKGKMHCMSQTSPQQIYNQVLQYFF